MNFWKRAPNGAPTYVAGAAFCESTMHAVCVRSFRKAKTAADARGFGGNKKEERKKIKRLKRETLK